MRVTMDGERIVPGIEQVWPRVDLLVCNPRFLGAVTKEGGVDESLRALTDRGPSRVAVTLAADGVLGLSDGRFVRVPGFPIKPVDTNGAGDVFHGAYIYSYLAYPAKSWSDHFDFARAASTFKIQRLGNESGLPTLADIVNVRQEFSVTA